MTWAFVYLSVLIVGLVLAGVTGLLRELPFAQAHRHLVTPVPEHHLSALNLLGRRLGLMMGAFGLVGLILQAWNRLAISTTLLISGIAALLAATAAVVLLRRPCASTLDSDRATVVRDITPGGFGQVRLGGGDIGTVMAARSADSETIPAGSEVEVVDCTRSVIIVRRPAST